ncbi:hypothetical protein B0T24DRAFT_97861 [Lasiosphaeria ovina]|uniref:Uncharacterized protein n=1 Tax=Lasiosphaeria ovina TaxID=92902 RepID=A0AAE0MZC1_9PEZI|nr:hypothetical protein B0T24DRAFT_97861 [Lasiosphaeria ovina]
MIWVALASKFLDVLLQSMAYWTHNNPRCAGYLDARVGDARNPLPTPTLCILLCSMQIAQGEEAAWPHTGKPSRSASPFGPSRPHRRFADDRRGWELLFFSFSLPPICPSLPLSSTPSGGDPPAHSQSWNNRSNDEYYTNYVQLDSMLVVLFTACSKYTLLIPSTRVPSPPFPPQSEHLFTASSDTRQHKSLCCAYLSAGCSCSCRCSLLAAGCCVAHGARTRPSMEPLLRA